MEKNCNEPWRAFQNIASAHPECNAVKLVKDLQRWFVEAKQVQIKALISLMTLQRP